MNTTQTQEEQVLDQSLRSLIIAHGYSKVLDRLSQWRPSYETEEVDPRYLMTLTPQEREPYLKASVDRALPAYEAEGALPESELELTADLETCDFHDFAEETLE